MRVRETLNHHKDFEENPDQEVIIFYGQIKARYNQSRNRCR
jgi:hypothetical protein